MDVLPADDRRAGPAPERKRSAIASREQPVALVLELAQRDELPLGVLEPLEQLDRLVQPCRRRGGSPRLLLRARRGPRAPRRRRCCRRPRRRGRRRRRSRVASRYMSSRSNGVTNVRLSRLITSCVSRSPSCSSSRMSREPFAVSSGQLVEQLDEHGRAIVTRVRGRLREQVEELAPLRRQAERHARTVTECLYAATENRRWISRSSDSHAAKARTTSGSNCRPDCACGSRARRVRPRERARGRAGRSSSRRARPRPRRPRAPSGISVPAEPVGVAARRPSARGASARSADAVALQERDAREHLLAEDRVRLHQLPLAARQRARLLQDRVRDPDLADVVEQEAVLERSGRPRRARVDARASARARSAGRAASARRCRCPSTRAPPASAATVSW